MPPTPDIPIWQNEKDLLRQVAAGSEEAFAVLFHRYRQKLFANIYKLTESREVAEDAVADTFLKIWISRARLIDIDNFEAYLKRAAQNHAYSGFRRMAKETLLVAELKRQEYAAPDQPGQVLMAKEVRDFIQQAISNLTPAQRRVFLLSRRDGLKQAEIAEKLGISLSTVKTHMVDALKQLREEVNRSYGAQAVALFVIYNLGHTL